MLRNKDIKNDNINKLKEEFTKAWDPETANAVINEITDHEEIEDDKVKEEVGKTDELKTPEVNEYGQKIIYGVVNTPNGGGLNLRVNPDKKASVLFVIPNGTRVVVKDFSDEWIIVKDRGYEGFCSKAFIKID